MLPIQKHQLNMNYSVGRVIIPEYIVIHETDNENKGANAMAHFNYWNSDPNASASVHFVVDDSNIVQLLELNQRAWHVGDNRGYSNITNSNTIGIEICVNSDGDYNKAIQNTIELVAYLLDATGLTIDKVVRHKDASGKYCPRRILDQNLWDWFKTQVTNSDKKYWVKMENMFDEYVDVAYYHEKYFSCCERFYAHASAQNTLFLCSQYLSKQQCEDVIAALSKDGLVGHLVIE